MKRLSTIIDDVQEQFGVWFSRVLIILVLLFIFFIALGGVSHKYIWRIEHINISGASVVSEDVARSLVRQKLEGSYFFVYARDNIRLFPKREIEQMLYETFPRIASVSARRTDNHTIVIEMKERKPYALWCGLLATAYRSNEAVGRPAYAQSASRWQAGEEPSSKDCWFIDESGFVFDRAPVFSKGVYMEVYGKIIEKNLGESLRGSIPYDRFATANAFAKLLNEQVGKPYSIFLKQEGELEITLLTSAKYPFLAEVSLRFKDESTSEILMKNLLSAIPVQFPNNIASKKKLLYIDMRFGNKVIFGFEN